MRVLRPGSHPPSGSPFLERTPRTRWGKGAGREGEGGGEGEREGRVEMKGREEEE